LAVQERALGSFHDVRRGGVGNRHQSAGVDLSPVNEPSRTLAPVTALFLIFAVVAAFFFLAVLTAPAFSCFLPTLFLPKRAEAEAEGSLEPRHATRMV
jgi:hypothetical protein